MWLVLNSLFLKTKLATTIVFVCIHVTCRRIFWQSMDDFYFLFENAIFEKNTKAIVHGFVKKWGFGVGDGIEPNYVSMCAYMS